MRSWTLVFVGTVAAFLGSPAAAQDAQAPTEQAPIVVEGRRDRDTEIREFVDALPPASPNEHILRFEHAACPAVLGLAPALKAQVVARMRAVAEAARVPLGGPNCRANVVVMVTADKRQLIDQLWRRHRYVFGGRSSGQIARLAESAAPAVLWHLNGQVDAFGRQLFSTMGQNIVNRGTGFASRIDDLAHIEFTGSVLVVEAAALTGLSAMQLADYAAVRTFSGADPARLPDTNLPTILTMLDAPMGSEVPVTLTHWDLALLESLYASDENIRAPAQRGEIRSGMRRQIDRASDGVQNP